jgi:ribulose-bisphosphate carboxylase large chain
MTVPVLTMFGRLSGASGMHTGTAGIGKMAGTPDIDIMASKQALNIQAQGQYFTQIWSKIPHADADLQAMIKEEQTRYAMNLRAFVKSQENVTHIDTMGHDWRVVRKMAPIISGGLNPVLLPQFLEIMGTIDFITTMGGGVHSHPMGTQAGTASVVQSYEAWKANVSLEEYAKDHQELKVAIEFYNQHGTQAHRIKGHEGV